jgi:hypothetical protein
MAKPQKPKIDELKLKSILQSERSAALGSSTSSDLSAQRIQALDYYLGDMNADMPAEEGLSAAVSTDVQDVVEGVLPIILDVFVSGDKVVEFKPNSAADEAAARQETDFINDVFYEQNPGFLTLYTAIKDALLQKNGFVKWWMEAEESRTRERYNGLTADAFAMLQKDTEVEITYSEQYDDIDPATSQPATYFNAIADRVKTKKRPKVMAVPPEEMLISKAARTIQDATYLAHVRNRPMADVIADFPNKAEQIKQAGSASPGTDNWEAGNRQTVQDTDFFDDEGAERATLMRQIEVVEHYIRAALEGDNVSRRYRITTVGSQIEVLDIEEITSWPFASATPIIMPHRLIGRSLADLTIDVQQIKTSLLRATLNNAYFANNQRVEVSETHASENTIDDLLNNRVGGIVRTRMPGGLNQLETQPIGHWVMPAIEYMDTVRENRTGVSKYNQGLDADSLNHTATGITRIMDAAEMRVKLMARIFAETLFVDMFRGLHQMIQEFGEEQLEAKLGDDWVTVNPREWATREHMKVGIPLGGASKQQLIAFFAQMLSIQKEALQIQGGPNGPLVSFQNIRNALDQMVRLAGLQSADPFFMQPPPPDPKGNPPPQDPKMVEAQAKAQATQAGQQADQQLQTQKLAFEQQLQTQKLQFDREREQDQFAHKMALDRMKFEHEMQMAQLKAGLEMHIQAAQAKNDMQINRDQADLDAELARKTANQQPQASV